VRAPGTAIVSVLLKPSGTSLAAVSRLAAAVDAFLLKILIEERLGYPVQLVSDGSLDGVESALNLNGTAASVYSALASGAADIYPEARWPTRLGLRLRVTAGGSQPQ
jgi:hypothetical protein